MNKKMLRVLIIISVASSQVQASVDSTSSDPASETINKLNQPPRAPKASTPTPPRSLSPERSSSIASVSPLSSRGSSPERGSEATPERPVDVAISTEDDIQKYNRVPEEFVQGVAWYGMHFAKKFIVHNIQEISAPLMLQNLNDHIEDQENPEEVRTQLVRMLQYISIEPQFIAYMMGYVQSCVWILQNPGFGSPTSKLDAVIDLVTDLKRK